MSNDNPEWPGDPKFFTETRAGGNTYCIFESGAALVGLLPGSTIDHQMSASPRKLNKVKTHAFNRPKKQHTPQT